MQKVIVGALLIGSAASATAQDHLRDTALQIQVGQEFARKLMQNALTVGKTGDVLVTFKGPHGWDCYVRVMNRASFGTKVTEPADSPERACVKAVLALNKQNAL